MIVVLIDPVREPIAGTVSEAGGEPTEFVGYAHLVAAIESYRTLAGGPDAGDNGRTGHGKGGGLGHGEGEAGQDGSSRAGA